MAFRIEREETVNRTFRLPLKLVDRMEVICNRKSISYNRLTILCIEYALAHLEQDDDQQEG